jgi:hypothetical protein
VEPEFTARTGPHGLRVADPIENVQFDLYTSEPVAPEPASDDAFYFPVDSVARVHAPEIEIPRLTEVYVRRQDGTLVGETGKEPCSSFERDRYNLDVATAQIKLYLAMDSAVTIRREDTSVVVSVDDPPVEIGARSLHDSPAGTVTTTDGITDMMRAVSTFGSALKTLSPDRSLPMHRGHPPLVEVGDEFSVPDGIERPDTNVTLEVPAEYDKLYPASTLAYYLGAEVVPNGNPRLVADGYVHDIDGGDGYEESMARTLKHVFYLDCVTRTEGYMGGDLYEREIIEDECYLDFGRLFDAPIDERVATYLRDVSWEMLEPHMPTWKHTTDVLPTESNVEVLSHTAYDLAIVRCPAHYDTTTVRAEPEELTEFYREPFEANGGSAVEVIQPEPADSIEHSWVGEGFPAGATKLTVDALRRELDAGDLDPGEISVDVVVNDPRMTDESAVRELFGDRDFVEFEVDTHYDLTAEDLRELLEDHTDFLHYVGHVDERGFDCVDEFLDAHTLAAVNARMFLLNACQSYEQGYALIERGAIGGIATLTKVGHYEALRAGKTLIRLLNEGFPLAPALDLTKKADYAAEHYTVLGNGSAELARGDGGVAVLTRIETLGDEEYKYQPEPFLNPTWGMGTQAYLNSHPEDLKCLCGGPIEPAIYSKSKIEEAFEMNLDALILDGEFRWPDDVSIEEF